MTIRESQGQIEAIHGIEGIDASRRPISAIARGDGLGNRSLEPMRSGSTFAGVEHGRVLSLGHPARWDRGRLGAAVSGQGPRRPAQRGAQDIPIAALDGIKGFPQTQTCIGPLPRHFMGFASLKGPWAPKRQKLCRPRSSTAIRSPNNRHRTGDGPEPRGSRSSTTRRAVRCRGHFPNGTAAAKSIYLAQTATSREWRRAMRQWQAVKSQRAIMFEDRFPMALSKRQRTEFRTISRDTIPGRSNIHPLKLALSSFGMRVMDP